MRSTATLAGAELQATAALAAPVVTDPAPSSASERLAMTVQEVVEGAVLEAEAKKLALAKEQAIAAEVERLRNRTKQEILEDTIADLKDQLASVKADRCKSCPHRA